MSNGTTRVGKKDVEAAFVGVSSSISMSTSLVSKSGEHENINIALIRAAYLHPRHRYHPQHLFRLCRCQDQEVSHKHLSEFLRLAGLSSNSSLGAQAPILHVICDRIEGYLL